MIERRCRPATNIRWWHRSSRQAWQSTVSDARITCVPGVSGAAYATPSLADVRIRIVGRDLPGLACGAAGTFPGYEHIHVAVQRHDHPAELLGMVPGDAPSAEWTLECDVVDTADGVDFKGPYISGRPHARFIYLSWGSVAPDGTFAMFRRAKLWLDSLDRELLDAAELGMLVGELGLATRAVTPCVRRSARPASRGRPPRRSERFPSGDLGYNDTFATRGAHHEHRPQPRWHPRRPRRTATRARRRRINRRQRVEVAATPDTRVLHPGEGGYDEALMEWDRQQNPDADVPVSTATGREEAMTVVHAVAESPDHAVAPAVEALDDPEAGARRCGTS